MSSVDELLDGQDPGEHAQDLIETAAEEKAEQDAQHNALLEAAAEGEEAVLESFETVTLGEVQITAHTQIPGRVMREMDRIYESDLPPGQMLDVYVDVLTEQTERIETDGAVAESEGDIRWFYRNWIDQHDAEAAAMLALERVVEQPNELEQKRKEATAQSFPGDQGSGIVRHPGRSRTSTE